MENYDDDDVERCFNWFRSFMSPSEWLERRAKIENYIEHAIMVGYGIDKAEAPTLSVSFNEDKIGWYMYLMDTCMNAASCYEPVAGARLFSIFKRLGECFTELSAIKGVNKKVRRLIKNDPTEADAVLFELLVALVWVRNGYTVSFIPELKHTRQPDIKAIKDGKEWFIECKRLSKSPDYSAREKAKWLKMLSYIRNLLMERDMVLDVTIHKELEKLPDTFLFDQLFEKLKLVTTPGWVVTNSLLSCQVWFVDYQAVNKHLEDFSVRSPSPQLNKLIAGKLDDNKGFSSGTMAQVFRLGPGIGNNIFTDQVGKAFGAFWSCDAPKATDKKARDIKQHLEKALSQLPMDEHSVVHVGIETYDGLDVEVERFKKINHTVNGMEIKNQNLTWIYVHFFQSYAPPDQSWVFDESLVRFNNTLLNVPEPLKHTSLIIPFDKTEENNMHWFKPQPL
ncbi:hypothetical protein [Mucilaginibacter sp. L196]|uniref:hypothetical protein n=1 Tax=Mucilaginibacter sp. L196 TaxID=1641870 RepID=UPI00131BCE25|nr:hypothetical protein [Mucilaginibacter sp. L196]